MFSGGNSLIQIRDLLFKLRSVCVHSHFHVSERESGPGFQKAHLENLYTVVSSTEETPDEKQLKRHSP
jgi:hypothetical protein